MINIKRILCPTDLSTEADEAQRYALALAKAYEAKLILHYCQKPGSVGDWASASRATELFRQSLFNRLDANELKTLDWTGAVCKGDDVGESIVIEAQKRKADLIIMRSRRRPHAAALLGSTAEKVCKTAPCPVLITHPNEVEWVGMSTEEIDLHRILIAQDFSSDSELALNYGCSLAEQYQTELHLLHVLASEGHLEPELAWSKGSGTAFTSVAHRLQRALPKEALLWCNVVNEVRCGKVHEVVLAYAKEHEIDLICMGASGSGWSLDKFFGSSVDRVLRQAPCPVLVVRPIKHDATVEQELIESKAASEIGKGRDYDNTNTQASGTY